MVFEVGVVDVAVGRFDVCVMPGVWVFVGVSVDVAIVVGIDVDVFVREAVGVRVESTVQVIINCGDWVALFSRV
jgi:hypothetical protein